MYLEHTETTYHNCNFVPSVKGLVGFRSICAWSEADVLLAKEAGSITALRDKPAFMDRIFLDFDNCEAKAMQAWKWFKNEEIRADLYHSGGRSLHIEADLVALYDVNAPYTVKQFMQQFDGVDLAPTHYAALFRLPDTVHAQTGNKKTLLEGTGLYKLELDLVQPTKFEAFDGDMDLYESVLVQYISLLGVAPGDGMRHTALWSLASSFRESGLSQNTVEELMLRLNTSWGKNGKDEDSVLRAIKD